ncbi:MAG: hypothetical protein FDX30_00220 [Chlorobium sp.]|nr:MAG: hypothetical protein FDX30_00220 [Chlorobium sp.]
MQEKPSPKLIRTLLQSFEYRFGNLRRKSGGQFAADTADDGGSPVQQIIDDIRAGAGSQTIPCKVYSRNITYRV